MFKAGLTLIKYYRKILGDDFWLKLHRRFREQWLRAAQNFYCFINSTETRGIGWICKNIIVQEGKNARFDFCSKTCVRTGNRYRIIRDFGKTLMNSRYYTGANRALLESPKLHRHAVALSNLQYYAHIPFFSEIYTRVIDKAEYSDKQKRQIEKYIRSHTSLELNNSDTTLNPMTDILTELQIYFNWKHKTAVNKVELVSILTQYRDCDNVVVPKHVANALIGCVQIMRKTKKQNNNRAKRRQRKKAPAPRSSKPAPSEMNNELKMKDLNPAENQYLGAIYNPLEARAPKIPSPFAVPTRTAKFRETASIVTNTNGDAFFFLNPWELNPLRYQNTVYVTETANLISYTGTQVWNKASPIVSSASAASWRVVSAELRATDLANSTVQTGRLQYGIVPNAFLTTGMTLDALLDQPSTKAMFNGKAQQGKALYLPADYEALDFTSTAGSKGTFYVPFFYCNRTSPGTTISVDFCINYEFIPSATQTDLLTPTPAAFGIIEKVFRHLTTTFNNGTFLAQGLKVGLKALALASSVGVSA